MDMKIAAIILITSAMALFGGCSTIDEARGLIGRYEQRVSKAALHDALWVACVKSSVGAIKAQFSTPEGLDAYNTICKLVNETTDNGIGSGGE